MPQATGWLKAHGALTAFIEPGAPWQNAFIESFHSRLDDELLCGEFFRSLTEAQVVIGSWVDDYNRNRPQRSPGKLTPNEFYERWQENNVFATQLRCEGIPESIDLKLTKRVDQEFEAGQRLQPRRRRRARRH